MTGPDRLVLNRHDGMDTLVIWERDHKLVVRWMITGYMSHERVAYIEAEVTEQEARAIGDGAPMDEVLTDVFQDLRGGV